MLWHELANPVPRANKFSLYSQSFHGNLISSTLSALSSSLAGFSQGFSVAVAPLWMFFFFCFLKAHIQFFLNRIPFKELSITAAADEVTRGHKFVNMGHSVQLHCSAVKLLLTKSFVSKTEKRS